MVCLYQMLARSQILINILLMLARIYYTVAAFCSPHEELYSIYGGTSCVDLRWCRYKVYTEARNWTDAKAICEQENQKLLHITNMDQHGYMTSLLGTSLPAIGLESGRSVYWIGLYRTTGGSPVWQDNCKTYDVENNPVIAIDEEEKCFMLNSANAEYHHSGCDESLPFICENTGNIDDMTCYTQAPTVYATVPTNALSYSADHPTTCQPFCLASECVGFRITSSSCVMLKYASGQKYTKGGTYKYAKAITITSSVDITNPVPSISDICKAVHVPTTTAISPSSTFDDVPTDSTSQYHIIYISLDKTVSVSSETNLESSMASSVQSEITYERTPELSTDFTTILRETTDPKTDMYTNDLPSHACPDCGCNSNHLTSISPEELQSMIDELKEELTVKKEDLSSWKRKLISVPDDRMSAKSLGYFGAGLLATVFGAIVLIDLPRFIRSAKSVFRAIYGQGGHDRQIYDVS